VSAGKGSLEKWDTTGETDGDMVAMLGDGDLLGERDDVGVREAVGDPVIVGCGDVVGKGDAVGAGLMSIPC